MMKRQSGFTILEVLVVVAIIGILSVTAVPVYHTWQQRAYGSEAAIMVKQIMDAQILYYLEHNDFFPSNTTYSIYHKGDPDPINAISDITKNLNINIPTGHFLDYYLSSYNDDGIYTFQLTISSLGQQFDIFNGVSYIAYKMDKDGNIVTADFRN